MAAPLPHNLFESCVCCNNPWSRGSDDAFAFICGACPEPIDPSFDINNFDHSTDPSDNFFQYANGGWMKANPIPAEYPNWNTFLALHVQNQERLKTTLQELQELAKSGDAASADPEHLKLATYYSAAMDGDAVEAAGVAPLAPMLALCEAAKEPAARVESIAKLYATFGTTSFFDVDASPDDKNSSHTIAQLSQGGLGLLDRDYYTDEDKAEKRELYVQHITKVLLLLECGYDDATAAAAAGLIMALETNLAESHMTKIACRDPEATYNLKTLEEVDAYGFDFSQWFTLIGKAASDVGSINVRNTGALECAASTIMGADAETIEHYLRWRVAKTWSSYLPAAFVDAEFEFYSKTLQGQKEQKPRWKRAMAQTESALGEAIGKICEWNMCRACVYSFSLACTIIPYPYCTYPNRSFSFSFRFTLTDCEKYFDSSSKAKALEIVESVRDALKQRLGEVDWMKSDETRDAALAKMAAFKIKLGFPDEWIDYSTFTPLSTDSFVECGCKATAFLIERELKEMNAPTDRVKWLMTPQTINAYYHPSLNEIVFPAAILQPPFFNPEADAAVNYGAMGAIVGHEMTVCVCVCVCVVCLFVCCITLSRSLSLPLSVRGAHNETLVVLFFSRFFSSRSTASTTKAANTITKETWSTGGLKQTAQSTSVASK